jgi:outer membrane lipoprotein-sorting protein
MKIRPSLPFLFLLAFALLSVATHAGADTRTDNLSVSFDQILTTSKGVFVTKVWIKGNKKRTESETQGRKQIDIIDGNTYIQVFPDSGFAQKMPLATDRSISAMAALKSSEKESSPETGTEKPMVIGTENLDNLECKIYQWKSENAFTRIWVSESFPFPLRWEEIDKKEGTFSYQVRNLKETNNIPDSYFEVPQGAKVINAEPGTTPAFPTLPK